MGRLIDEDILIAELKESALHYCNNPREDSLLQRDRVIVRAQPTVQAIPKTDYENRLKADMVAMLTELQLEIEELENPLDYDFEGYNQCAVDCEKLIQQKIDKLKEAKDGENNY